MAFSNLKKGGFGKSDTSFDIITGGLTYCGGEEIDYWLSLRASKIEKAKIINEKFIKELYPFLGSTSLSLRKLYEYILDNSTVSGLLITQLNIIIDSIINLEINIKNLQCKNLKFITIPEETVIEDIISKIINKKAIDGLPKEKINHGIKSNLIYNPDDLQEIINRIIEYINAFVACEFVGTKSSPQMQDPRFIFDDTNRESIKPIKKMKKQFHFYTLENLKDFDSNLLDKLFKKEIKVSKYIKELEIYFGYVIEQLNIVIVKINDLNAKLKTF